MASRRSSLSLDLLFDVEIEMISRDSHYEDSDAKEKSVHLTWLSRRIEFADNSKDLTAPYPRVGAGIVRLIAIPTT